jgi:hypothetical protein
MLGVGQLGTGAAGGPAEFDGREGHGQERDTER